MAATPEDTLIIETTHGPVTVELRPDLAPNHVARIKELAREGFYDGVVFHRVIDGFMAQTGDPDRHRHAAAPARSCRPSSRKEPHTPRRRARWRARSRPNSADSQFFICFDDASFLDGKYTVWGTRDRRHGECRQDQARRAAGASRTRSLTVRVAADPA